MKKLVLALLALGFMTSVSNAQTARRAGMDNNQLIEDHDDVYIFPQKAQSKYNQNRVKFDMDAAGNNSGTIFSGNGEAAWGIAINKIGAPAVNGQGYRTAVQTVDAFWSVTRNGADLGLRVGLATGANEQGAVEQTHTDINLVAGYSRDSAEAAHDFSIIADYGIAENKDQLEGNALTLAVNYRGYLKDKVGKNVDLGIIVQAGNGSTEDTPEGGDAAESSFLAGSVGAGPVFRAGKSTVALLGATGYLATKDPSDTEVSAVLIPGVNVAFESPMNDWLTFRGGIGYARALTTSNPDGGDESTDTAGATTYSVGMSATWEKLLFDVAINRDFLLNGPFALTGTQTPNWASQASVTFEW